MPDLVSVIIPVKPGSAAKSRLGGGEARRAALAEAIALDTVDAARASVRVGTIVVVGRLPRHTAGVREIEDPGAGLLGAIDGGLALLGAEGPIAVLLGDLPALRPAELDEALLAATGHERAFVPDAEGVGTTLIVARAGVPHAPRFGGASAAQHRAAGYVELEVPRLSGLRRDVDTWEQLSVAASLSGGASLGPRTRALLEAQ